MGLEDPQEVAPRLPFQQVEIPDIEEAPVIKSFEEMRRDRYVQRHNEKKESIKRLFANAV